MFFCFTWYNCSRAWKTRRRFYILKSEPDHLHCQLPLTLTHDGGTRDPRNSSGTFGEDANGLGTSVSTCIVGREGVGDTVKHAILTYIFPMTDAGCRNTYPQNKTAAVLILLFEREGVLRVLLTTRSKHLRSHPGQVRSFQ
jgi:hypothetical protein